MKKVFFLLLFFAFLFTASSSLAIENLVEEVGVDETEEVTIHYFDDRLCPVCADAKDFLQKRAEDDKRIDLNIYQISDTDKLREIAKEHGVEDYYVMAPTIFIGESFLQFTEFSSNQEEKILSAIEGEAVERDCCVVRVPILGIEMDTSELSLGVAAMGLGIIDGFNVCSIGALILILTIVLALDSRKKMLFFGGLFIFTTVAVYGSLVFVWGWLLEMLIGEQETLRMIIGFAALAGSIYFFKEFWRFFKYGPTCKSSDSFLAKGATEKLRKSFEDPKRGMFYLALSVVSFAGIITIVELPCSVGIPLTFSGILAGADIPLLSYVFYILIFLFFYMLIEIVIFVGAILTKNIWFAGSKAITWITFLGALVLLYLAIYYLPWV